MTAPDQRAKAEPRIGSTTNTASPTTHLANARRIVEHFGDCLLFVEGIGWHCWGPPWRLDELGARRTVHALGKIVAQEAAELAQWVAKADDKTERTRREEVMQGRFKWARECENSACIEASLRVAASLLCCKADAMDAQPLLLGTPSGVLDLNGGSFRKHDQRDRITKITGCDFDVDATAPTWARFIEEVFGADGELIEYVQRLIGYTLSGKRGEHVLPILWGSGANGKSTFLGALQVLLGEYAGGAAPGLLIQRGGNDHPTSLADLQGRRMVIASETGETGRLNEEQVKLLTGGDALTARRMRMDFYTFAPTHQLFLQTNHRPRVTGTDEGIWRRLRLIPFNVTIPPERRDPRLGDKLRAEAAGILTWALHGWQSYCEKGFNDPAAVRVATAEYRDASDQVGAFLGECCEVDSAFTTTAANLYQAYVRWAQDGGERARSQRDFGMRLSERGFERVRYGSGIRWRGLRVNVPNEPCESDFGLSTTRKNLQGAYIENSSHRSQPYTDTDAYRLAKDGEL